MRSNHKPRKTLRHVVPPPHLVVWDQSFKTPPTSRSSDQSLADQHLPVSKGASGSYCNEQHIIHLFILLEKKINTKNKKKWPHFINDLKLNLNILEQTKTKSAENM